MRQLTYKQYKSLCLDLRGSYKPSGIYIFDIASELMDRGDEYVIGFGSECLYGVPVNRKTINVYGVSIYVNCLNGTPIITVRGKSKGGYIPMSKYSFEKVIDKLEWCIQSDIETDVSYIHK